MVEVKVTNALKMHKDFILYSNRMINNINEMDVENNLVKNIDKDLYSDNPLFKCLIAEIDDKPVGMILYSHVYWANDGKVAWISQMFIEEAYRKYGVFFKLIKQFKEDNKDSNIVCCMICEHNLRMKKILKGYGCKEISYKSYFKKLS